MGHGLGLDKLLRYESDGKAGTPEFHPKNQPTVKPNLELRLNQTWSSPSYCSRFAGRMSSHLALQYCAHGG